MSVRLSKSWAERIEHASFAFGDYDLVAIVDMPSNVEAAAFSLAAAAGGAIRSIKTTPLLTTAEGIAAMKKAATSGYKAPTRAARQSLALRSDNARVSRAENLSMERGGRTHLRPAPRGFADDSSADRATDFSFTSSHESTLLTAIVCSSSGAFTRIVNRVPGPSGISAKAPRRNAAIASIAAS